MITIKGWRQRERWKREEEEAAGGQGGGGHRRGIEDRGGREERVREGEERREKREERKVDGRGECSHILREYDHATPPLRSHCSLTEALAVLSLRMETVS
jgi:hypothetical protein